jgi:hypothetical protein
MHVGYEASRQRRSRWRDLIFYSRFDLEMTDGSPSLAWGRILGGVLRGEKSFAV